eukprot:m.1274515 g.1274515  ORF g.1274515 m.1274515 type:complete len:222 (+) comp24758_c0_seq13:384-1049(+)
MVESTTSLNMEGTSSNAHMTIIDDDDDVAEVVKDPCTSAAELEPARSSDTAARDDTANNVMIVLDEDDDSQEITTPALAEAGSETIHSVVPTDNDAISIQESPRKDIDSAEVFQGGVTPTAIKRRRRRVKCAVCAQSHQMRGARQFEACEHGVGMECLASIGDHGEFFLQADCNVSVNREGNLQLKPACDSGGIDRRNVFVDLVVPERIQLVVLGGVGAGC